MTANKTKVLFVDDEPSILMLLKTVLRSMAEEWDLSFCGSGREALEFMGAHPVQILVTDMRMPTMSGAELLAEVKQRYPGTMRIVLSGYADQAVVFRVIGLAHLFLEKPVLPQTLKSTLHRIHGLYRGLLNSKIRDLVTDLSCLPSMPEIYFDIVNELQSSEVSSSKVGQIVAQDPGLTSKILQVANSAFFGSASHISNAVEAVQFLGVGVIASLALTHQVFSSLDPQKYREFQVEKLWRHSFRTGLIARAITRLHTRNASLAEAAFTAGVLHDVGKLIFIDTQTDLYRRLWRKATPDPGQLSRLENHEFNTSHANLGGFLLGIWGLPVSLVDAVSYHETPSLSGDQEFTELTAVHVANAFEQADKSADKAGYMDRLDTAYLSRLNLLERVKDWHGELNLTH